MDVDKELREIKFKVRNLEIHQELQKRANPRNLDFVIPMSYEDLIKISSGEQVGVYHEGRFYDLRPNDPKDKMQCRYKDLRFDADVLTSWPNEHFLHFDGVHRILFYDDNRTPRLFFYNRDSKLLKQVHHGQLLKTRGFYQVESFSPQGHSKDERDFENILRFFNYCGDVNSI